MNPMQLLYNINNMNQVETFNYIRYHMEKLQVRNIVEFYENKFQTFIELDQDLQMLNESLQANIKIMKDYLQ